MADAELRRDVDHEAVLEARHLLAHEIDQRIDALAPFEVGARQVLDLQPVIAGHVRAVAPHDAGQRRLEPPVVPRAAHRALGLPVERRECFRFGGREALGLVGVHIAEPEHRADDVGAFDEFCARRCRHVEIAGGVDHRVGEDRLASGFRFADHAADAAVLHDRPGEPRMQPHIDARRCDQIVRDALPAVRIERRRHHDRLRFCLRAEVMTAPARPFAVFVPALAALLGRRIDAGANLGHALDHFHAQAGDGGLFAVVHVVEHQHHAAGCKPAEIGIALDQRHCATLAPRRDRRRKARRPAADHQHVRTRHDARGAGCFFDAVRGHCGLLQEFEFTAKASSA